MLLDFSGQIHILRLDDREQSLIEQSREALLLSSASDKEDLIQSETEGVTKDWGIIHDPLHPQARGIVTKLKTKTIAG